MFVLLVQEGRVLDVHTPAYLKLVVKFSSSL